MYYALIDNHTTSYRHVVSIDQQARHVHPMLVYCLVIRRQWNNINPKLHQHLVFAVVCGDL